MFILGQAPGSGKRGARDTKNDMPIAHANVLVRLLAVKLRVN